jgi:hypothetical protein
MTGDATPKLLSGGNPQVAKGYGDGPVQTYIDAMPDWKHAIGKQIDAIVEEVVPDVVKAIKWNSPFYGMEKDSWFLSYHCFTKYIKLTFFRGSSLEPHPPEKSKYDDVRYFHIYQGDDFSDQLTDWVRQASQLPGEKL